MVNKTTKRTYLFLLSCTFAIACNFQVRAQVLRDTATFRLMQKGVDCIYNMQFSEAREIYRQVVNKYPEHPIISVYKGLITYWENYPLTTSSPQKEAFEKDMLRAIELCEKKQGHESDPEYLLSNVGARGLLLLFYADNDQTREVISMASGTYQYIKLSFNFTQTYADFYFVTGLYNYYREAYPEAHPVYKPVAMLFPRGDKIRGLKEMQYAAKNALVVKAESYSFLSGIYISFENNFEKAYHYSKLLCELYPGNIQYRAQYIKNLLLMKRYDEAENLINQSMNTDNAYFKGQLRILNGILSEKKYRNPKQAEQVYRQGIGEIEPYGGFASEFVAYGYFGLSRVVQDKKLKKEYRKKAVELADFKNVNFDR